MHFFLILLVHKCLHNHTVTAKNIYKSHPKIFSTLRLM